MTSIHIVFYTLYVQYTSQILYKVYIINVYK